MKMRNLRAALFALVACVPLAAAASAAEVPDGGERATIAGLDVAVWRPAEGAGPSPLVVFSHGFRGCNTRSSFLMRAFADAGYLAMAPNHADASCHGERTPMPEQAFGSPRVWTPDTYRRRADDVRRLIAALGADPAWAPLIDRSRIALAGHSLGGYVALGLVGGWRDWTLPEAKAALALSPYCDPLADHGDLGTIGVPVMYQGGTHDSFITPSVEQPGGCFDRTASPAMFVDFKDAGHLAWTDQEPQSHALIVAWSLWFLDGALKGKEAPPPGGAFEFRRR
jgi:pimeloyl-ACP methyl ester carboxylesterase